MRNENHDLTVQIQKTTDPKRKRIVLEYTCEVEQYDITVADGKMTDVLKVMEAMYEQEMFCHRNGTTMKKGEFMAVVGMMMNVNTNRWAQLLSNSYDKAQSLEPFTTLSRWAKSRWLR